MTHMRYRLIKGGDEAGLDQPVRLDGLAEGEQVVIRAFRRWVAGGEGGNDAWNHIAARFGGRPGRPIMAALILLVERLRESARRPIRHHAACCPCLSADEVRLLSLIAIAGIGRIDRARSLAADLIGLDLGVAGAAHQPESLDLAEAAHRLATALSRHGVATHDRPGVPRDGGTGPVADDLVAHAPTGHDADRVAGWLN